MSEGTKADISWEENIPVSKVPVTYCPIRIKKKKCRSYSDHAVDCGVGEDPWASLGLEDVEPVHPSLEGLRTDAEAEAPILWPPDAGKDWGQEGKGAAEGEMVGRHHQANEYEFEQAPGDSEGQGRLVCWGPWDHKESDNLETE